MITLTLLFGGRANATSIDANAKCLADNIYYEARDDGRAGWNAVGHVTLNRWHSAQRLRTNVSVCDIVYAGAHRGRHHCQFSWACHRTGRAKIEKDNAAKIQELAYRLQQPKSPAPPLMPILF